MYWFLFWLVPFLVLRKFWILANRVFVLGEGCVKGGMGLYRVGSHDCCHAIIALFVVIEMICVAAGVLISPISL